MTDPEPQEPDAAAWKNRQFFVAVVLLAAFAALVGVMLVVADAPNETVWQRRVYLFGAVEAIVFTAVGWLFGREVSRSAAQSAQQAATDAKQEAATARDEAKQKAEEAARAEQKAAEERTRAQAVASVIAHSEPAGASGRPGVSQEAGIGGGAARSAGAVVDLKALVRDLYGQ